MTDIILVVHVLLAVGLIGVVLLQRSEGGGLGIGGGASSFMTGRGKANILTKATVSLAAAFMATSILLSFLAARESTPRSITDDIPSGLQSNQEDQSDGAEVPVVPVE